MREFFVQVCPGGVCKGEWRSVRALEAHHAARQFGGTAVRKTGTPREIRVLVRPKDGRQVIPFYAPVTSAWPANPKASPAELAFA